MLEEILNDKEMAEVQKYLANDTLKQSIKKILLYGVYDNGVLKAGEDPKPMMNFAITIDQLNGEVMSDELIGQVLRAKRSAIELIEVGFTELEKLRKEPEVKKDKVNKAR